MTRLFTDGAETGDLTFFDNAASSAIDSSLAGRSGNYCYKVNTNIDFSGYKLFISSSEIFFRCRIYLDVHVADTGLYFYNGSQPEFYFRNNGVVGRFEVYNGAGSLVASSSVGSLVKVGGWYLLELRLKIDNSVGVIQVKIDGVMIIDYSGDAQYVNTTVNKMYFTRMSNNTYYDDLALNNAVGSADNSWCGDGRIIALVPNASGYSSQWLGSDGDSTNNYALIDELPPSDSDYVRATGSSYIDAYDLSTYDFAGQTIQRIWLVSRAKSDASGDYFLQGIRVSGTNYMVTGSLPTSFGRIDVSATGTWNVNPFTNNPWSQEQINNLQLVIQSP